jgi:hypothetical protein
VNSWTSVAMSNDGSSMLATSTSSGIFQSTNSGSSWIPLQLPSSIASSASPKGWGSVSISWDGQNALAVTPSLLIQSSDAGTTWTSVSANQQGVGVLTITDWVSISMARTPRGFATTTSHGIFSVNTFLGVATLTGAPSWLSWGDVAQSARGTLVAAICTGPSSSSSSQPESSLYISSDFGSTFQPSGDPATTFLSVAVNSPAQFIVASTASGVQGFRRSGLGWRPPRGFADASKILAPPA